MWKPCGSIAPTPQNGPELMEFKAHMAQEHSFPCGPAEATHQHCLEEKTSELMAGTENLVSDAGSKTREQHRKRVIQRLRHIQLHIEENWLIGLS